MVSLLSFTLSYLSWASEMFTDGVHWRESDGGGALCSMRSNKGELRLYVVKVENVERHYLICVLNPVQNRELRL